MTISSSSQQSASTSVKSRRTRTSPTGYAPLTSQQMSSTIANASCSFVFMVDVLQGEPARWYVHGGVPEAATGPSEMLARCARADDFCHGARVLPAPLAPTCL